MERKSPVLRTLPLLLAATSLLSCQKDLNPKAVSHSDAEFTLTLSELRQGAEFTWRASEDSPLHCDEVSLQEFWMTSWNSATLTAESAEKDFDGVNFSSSDTEVVSVEKLDERTCRLVFRSSSDTTVTVTASSGPTHSVSIEVHSEKTISLRGVLISVGDLPVEIPVGTYRERILPDDEAYVWMEKTVDYATYPGDTVRLVSLIPENASFRHLKLFRSEIPDDTMEGGITERCGGSGGTVRDIDWGEIEGLEGFYKPSADPLSFNMDFLTATADVSDSSSGKLRTAALRARYDYEKRQK